ncbi:MAG: protein-export chaperone SecB [Rhodospirillaceae bacterium]
MSEETPQAAPQPQQPPLVINGQYIKDLSFEVPGAPQIFGELDGPPDIPINVEVSAKPLSEKAYQVSLHIRAESRVKEKIAFIAELEYCAIATSSLPQEQVQPLLLIEVPRMMFPFARNIIADVTRDSGFPPLMIAPLDFVALYKARAEQNAAAAGTPPAS